MDENNWPYELWFYIEDNIGYSGTELEYFWYLIRKTTKVLSTQDMDLVLNLLWDLEEFTLGTLNYKLGGITNKLADIARRKIIGSNTQAERTLLLNETLTREVINNHNNGEDHDTDSEILNSDMEDEEEETLDEQRNRIWQQAMEILGLEVDYDRLASPAA